MKSGPIGKVRCAIYTRVSTDQGLDQDFNSLDAQYEASSAYIKSQAHAGWTLIRSRYDDGGYSGGSTDRPNLQRLLEDVRARKIDVIVVYKVDRLTRSLADFAKLVELFDAHGVSFVSVTRQFNTTTSMGRLTLNVLLSFAQFERCTRRRVWTLYRRRAVRCTLSRRIQKQAPAATSSDDLPRFKRWFGHRTRSFLQCNTLLSLRLLRVSKDCSSFLRSRALRRGAFPLQVAFRDAGSDVNGDRAEAVDVTGGGRDSLMTRVLRPACKQKSNHLARNGLAFLCKPSIAVRTGSR
jgi:DNA invertase Pin-like site-specific DNA recombinase